jgi:hypothetical protein
MKFRSAFALALLVAVSSAARADSDTEPTATGFWELQNDDGKPKAWFLFTEKDDVYSGRLVKAFKQPDEDKPPQTICVKCPGEKKGAHIMGLTLFYNMKRDGLKYRDGSVLDPRDGSIYHAQMDLSEDGQELSVRGYIGIPMLGKTQVWHRLPDDAMKTEDIPKEILADSEGASGDNAKAGDKTKAVAKSKHGQSAATEKSKSHKHKADKPKPDNAEADSQSAAPGDGSQ